MSQSLGWAPGVRLGLVSASAGVVVLLLVSLLSAQDAALVGETGARVLLWRAGPDLPPGAAYLVVHVTAYLVAGLAAVLLAGAADRAPGATPGLVTLVTVVELGVLVLTMSALTQGPIDTLEWRASLAGHAAADLVFFVFLFRGRASKVRDLRESSS